MRGRAYAHAHKLVMRIDGQPHFYTHKYYAMRTMLHNEGNGHVI